MKAGMIVLIGSMGFDAGPDENAKRIRGARIGREKQGDKDKQEP